MLQRRSAKGFTVVEILIVVAIIGIIFIWGGLICGVIKGNFWLSDKTALKAIRVDHGEIVKIVDINRNVFARSVVIAEDEDGNQSEYRADANVLWEVSVEKITR